MYVINLPNNSGPNFRHLGARRRYAHLAVGHLAVYADNVKIIHGTILAQLQAPQAQLDS
jgi:hypothetical protein